jgi:hypothetical protein
MIHASGVVGLFLGVMQVMGNSASFYPGLKGYFWKM